MLSCHSCHKLFHPVCVGLMEGPDYDGFDFYCADCPPPLGKETVEMPPPIDEMLDVSTELSHPTGSDRIYLNKGTDLDKICQV